MSRRREALADAGSAERRPTALWQGEAGEAAAQALRHAARCRACPRPTWRRPTTRSSIAASSPRRRSAPRAPAHPRICHLGALRVAPAAARRRRSSARSTRAPGRSAADPGPWLNRPMRADARPAGAGGAHRRCRAHLHLAARRRPGLSHARRQDRRRADGALALAAAAAGAARGPRATAPGADQPWLAWAQARNALDGRRTARARARAEAGAGAAAAPAQRDGDREVDRQPLRHLRRAHPAAGAAARCSAASPMRRCAARSCTTRSAASRKRFPQRLPDDTCAELVALAERGAGGADRLAAGGGLLGAALCPLRRLVRRDRARPARGHRATASPRWRAPSC